MYHSAVIAAVLLSSTLVAQNPAPVSCPDAASCRQAATEAADRGELETFHDLAWLAVRKGKPNDPELMMLLARAQSLSGRPGDALVMLRRLAQMGVVVDIQGEDFRRVRALPGWTEVEALLAAARGKPGVEPVVPSRAAPPGSAPPAKAPASPLVEAGPAAAPKNAPAPAVMPPPANFRGEEAIRIPETGIAPIGLAYDSASRRFVVGDRHRNKVIVADEVFKQVNDLIGAGSGGFGALTALEIDRSRGDLWVTSAENGSASVHKLQLVSGRVLTRIELPEAMHPATITDISLAENGALLLVDAAGGRLLTLPPASRVFGRPVALGVISPRTIALASATIAYLAHDGGLSSLDLKSGTISAVQPAKGVTLTGLERIRWHRGSIVAIQRADGDRPRLVRILLSSSGRRASSLHVIDDHSPLDGSALTVSANEAYYLAEAEDGPVIRRVPLR